MPISTLPQGVEKASYTILGCDRSGQPLDIPWRTPHMPTLDGTIFLPDRNAGEHPWRAMAITGIAHYPDRTEVVLSPADEIDHRTLAEIFEQASVYAAENF
jgi:hypothetical protein